MNCRTCSVCFVVCSHTVDIVNTHLQVFYEKLTGSMLQNESHCLCYICKRRLQKCYQFQLLAIKKNPKLQNPFYLNVNDKQNTAEAFNPLITLTMSKTLKMTIPSQSKMLAEKILNIKQEKNIDCRDGLQLDRFNYLQEKEIKIELEPLNCFITNIKKRDNDSGIRANDKLQNAKMANVQIEQLDTNVVIYEYRYLSSVREYTFDIYHDHTNRKNLLKNQPVEQYSKTDNNKLFKNKNCPFVNKKELNVLSHELSHNCDKHYRCDICMKSFSEKHILIMHLRTHAGEIKTKYTCDLCNKSYTNNGQLLRHKRKHSGEKPFGCDICGKTFYENSHLTEHKRVHTGDKPYICDICKKKFSQSSNLIRHKSIHATNKPVCCNLCEKRFSNKGYLKSHLRSHRGDKPYSCEICNKKFSAKHAVLSHKTTHTGERPYTCNICEKTFPFSSSLLRHRVTHTNETYICDICAKTFSQSRYLIIHKRKHTGEKPFSCDVCEKSFSDKGNLVRHKKSHTGIRPYSCDICGNSFSVRNSLKSHKTIHTGTKPLHL